MLKDIAVKKVRVSVPKTGFSLPDGKELIGIHIVIEDFYMSLDPILITDTVFALSDLKETDIDYSGILDLQLNHRSNLAMKYRFIFNDVGVSDLTTASYTEFSLPTSFYGNQEGIKLDGLEVLTPVLNIEERYSELNGDILRIKGSEFKMPIGDAKHKATNWKIHDTNDTDNIIFLRRQDKTHLRELEIPLDKFDPRKLYTIECSYISTKNNESLTGRFYYNRIVELTDTSKVRPILPFFNTYDMFFRVDIKNPQASKLWIRVYLKQKDGSNKFWKSVKCALSSYAYIPQGELSHLDLHGGIEEKNYATNHDDLKVFPMNAEYSCYYVVEQLDGTLTREEKICDFYRRESTKFIYPDSGLKYPGKYTAMYPIQTGDFVCCSQELQGGVILIGNYKENSISFFRKEGLSLRDLGFKLTLPTEVPTNQEGYPIFSVIQANDGMIYINYPIYKSMDGNGTFNKRSAWIAGRLNPVTYKWKQLAHAVYEEEIIVDRAVTAVSGIEGIYYIPQGVLKNPNIKSITSMNNDELVPSSLYHLRLVKKGDKDAELVRVKVIDELIKGVVTGIGLTSNEGSLEDRKYFLVGGKDPNTDRMLNMGFEVSETMLRKKWKDSQDLVYPPLATGTEKEVDDQFKETRGVVISRALTLKIEIPGSTKIEEFDSLTILPRGDGKHVLFNDTTSNVTSKASNSILVDFYTSGTSARVETNDSKIDLPFINTIQLREGGFLRLSANLALEDELTDMKHLLWYPSVDLSAYHDYMMESEKVLVVRKNRRVKVTDLRRYESVVIEGTSLQDTGKLVYIDNGVLKVFDYMDVIITRDIRVTQAQADEHAMKRLYLLDGVNYEITN